MSFDAINSIFCLKLNTSLKIFHNCNNKYFIIIEIKSLDHCYFTSDVSYTNVHTASKTSLSLYGSQ